MTNPKESGNAEAAKYRTRLREVEAERDAAIARAEAAEQALTERAEADQEAAAQSEHEALRAEIATATGISSPSILRGTTREELEAHAAELKPLINPHPVLSDPGKTPENTATGMSWSDALNPIE